MELLSASADKSLMIWSPTGPDGVWLYQVNFIIIIQQCSY
jgi:hypothetical protein